MSNAIFEETLHPRGQSGNAGQFRAKVNDAPAGGLAAPERTFPAVKAIVVFQQTVGDEDHPIRRAEIDIADVFDGMDFEDLPSAADDYDRTDSCFFHAQKMGLIDKFSGPFEIEIDEDELADYRASRESRNQMSAIKTMPWRAESERRESVATRLRSILPEGGLAVVSEWDDRTASAWAAQAHQKVTLGLQHDYVQHELLDEGNKAVLEQLRQAAMPRLEGNAYRVRTAVFATYEHLAKREA